MDTSRQQSLSVQTSAIRQSQISQEQASKARATTGWLASSPQLTPTGFSPDRRSNFEKMDLPVRGSGGAVVETEPEYVEFIDGSEPDGVQEMDASTETDAATGTRDNTAFPVNVTDGVVTIETAFLTRLSKLSHTAQAVYLSLVQKAARDGRNYFHAADCYLAKAVGVHKNSIGRYSKELSEAGMTDRSRNQIRLPHVKVVTKTVTNINIDHNNCDKQTSQKLGFGMSQNLGSINNTRNTNTGKEEKEKEKGEAPRKRGPRRPFLLLAF